MKKLDIVILNVSTFFILFFIALIPTKNVVGAIFISFLSTVTINYLLIHLTHRHKLVKKISVSEMEDSLALMGSDQVDFIKKVVPDCFEPQVVDGFIEATVNCDKILIISSYKFSPNGADDLARFYRAATAKGIKKAVILGRMPTRSVILFASRLDVEFRFVQSAKLRKFLYSQNSLPPKIYEKTVNKREKTAIKEKIKAALSTVFVKKRAKHFLTAGVACAILGLFTPLKIYYGIAAIILLFLAFGCLIKDRI